MPDLNVNVFRINGTFKTDPLVQFLCFFFVTKKIALGPMCAAFFFGGEEIGWLDLAQIQAEYAHRYFATSFSFSCLTLYQVARTHMRHHQCPSTCFKEILKQAKKFLNCLSQDQIYHPMPSTLADLLC